MIFEACFEGIEIETDDKAIIDCSIQAFSIDVDEEEYLDCLKSLSKGESIGYEVAYIYLESDMEEDDLPQFEGVCFGYQDEYAVVSVEDANKILKCSLKVLGIDFDWEGIKY
ncbi:hypothetical protein [Hahella ganghwensis]|uniref:hypothetical protein n=1 Tax=Hahella ganghwensis TaxID=286420 RepID=UPI00036A08F1|nr:hypothetical protein [Hahella ganghwensis]